MKILSAKTEESEVRNLLGLKINHLISKLNPQLKSENQKILEICHIGKLISTFFPDFEIVEIREKPDFIISNGKLSLAVEHQLVLDFEEKGREGFYNNICTKAEEIITQDLEFPNFLINLHMKKNLPFKIQEKNYIINEIVKVTKHFILTKELIENDFVYDILAMENNRKSICPNFGAYSQKWINEDIIKNYVSKKEEKLTSYNKNVSIPICLLLVIGSTGNSSYEVNSPFDTSFKTKFDKILLFEDFNNKLYEL